MAQWCGRIHIRVKESSDWRALTGIHPNILKCIGIEDGEEFEQLLSFNTRDWCASGEGEVFFGDSYLANASNDFLLDTTFVVKTLADALRGRAVIIADTCDIDTDPFTSCRYYLGEGVKNALFSSLYGDQRALMFDKANIEDISQWLSCGKFKLSDSELDYLNEIFPENKFPAAQERTKGFQEHVGVLVPVSDLILAKKGKKYVVMGYTGKETDLILPDEIDGVVIAGIGKEAFANKKDAPHNKNIKSVRLPTMLEFIDRKAFYHCFALEEIVMPKTLKKVGFEAFDSCQNLKRAVYGGSVESWINIEFAMSQYPCSYSCTANPLAYGAPLVINQKPVEKIVVPGSVREIPNGVFYGANIKAVTIGEGVEKIGKSVFGLCERLTCITLPQTMKHVDNAAFYGCACLTDIVFQDNVILGRDVFRGTGYYDISDNWDGNFLYVGTHLVDKQYMNEQKTYQIKDGTRSISGDMFCSNENVTNITLPEGVMHIGIRCFWACENLTSVIVPDSVISIGEESFLECPQLVLCVSKNSYAEQYAIEHGLRMEYHE